MKVNDIKEVSGLPETATPRQARTADVQQDRVSVTQTHEVLRALEGAKAHSSVGRGEQLRQLEQSVRSGAYQPNAAQIAERILDDAELAAKLQAMLRT